MASWPESMPALFDAFSSPPQRSHMCDLRRQSQQQLACPAVRQCSQLWSRSLYLSLLNAAGISPAGASLLDDSDDNHEGQISREEREILPPRPITAFKVKRIMQKCTCFKYPLNYKMCAVWYVKDCNNIQQRNSGLTPNSKWVVWGKGATKALSILQPLQFVIDDDSSLAYMLKLWLFQSVSLHVWNVSLVSLVIKNKSTGASVVQEADNGLRETKETCYTARNETGYSEALSWRIDSKLRRRWKRWRAVKERLMKNREIL